MGLVIGLRNPEAAAAAAQAMQAVPTVLFLDCGPEFRKQTRLGGIPVLSKDAFTQAIAKLVPWSKGGAGSGFILTGTWLCLSCTIFFAAISTYPDGISAHRVVINPCYGHTHSSGCMAVCC